MDQHHPQLLPGLPDYLDHAQPEFKIKTKLSQTGNDPNRDGEKIIQFSSPLTADTSGVDEIIWIFI